MISFNFDGKEMYTNLLLALEDNPGRSYTLDQCCIILETSNTEQVVLILDQLSRENKIESGLIHLDDESYQMVYTTRNSYDKEGNPIG